LGRTREGRGRKHERLDDEAHAFEELAQLEHAEDPHLPLMGVLRLLRVLHAV
jgi:hypothetical protein